MRKPLNTLYMIIVLVFVFDVGFIIGRAPLGRANVMLATQQVCDRSRTVQGDDKGLENWCATIQRDSHTEYLCNSLEPDAICWVEDKL